ncbi:MAG: glycosyltransferase family 4 protein [Magnetospirillum sp.]|nr:glycosyltransferase family 4 protein [Magnetospirillum sp.]
MKSYDGSAAIYKAWLNHLTLCGHDVSVLSFNQARTRWDGESVEELRRQVTDLLIVDVFPNLAMAGLCKLTGAVWRVIAGRRYLPEWLAGLFRSPQRHQIADFFKRHDFDVVVVNKVCNTDLVGSANLASMRGVRVVDIHDNDPQRSLLMRSSILKLFPRLPKMVARLVRVQELSDLLNWAGKDRMMREEIRALMLYDHVLFSSREEAATFAAAGLPLERIHVSPWPFENVVGGSGEVLPRPEGPRPYHLGMIGASGLFNMEAVLFLAEEVLPRLRRRIPDIKVLIAGGICRQIGDLFKGDAAITLVPWFDGLDEFYGQVEVVVVPLLSGTGVSIKSLEAAWLGSAMVSTPTGVRGLELADERHFLQADDADQFADMVARLLGDDDLRRNMRASAAREIRVRHSSAAFASAMAPLFCDDRGQG